MIRRLITVLFAGVTSLAIYFAASGTTPNRAITCEFAISDELRAVAADAGFKLARHEQLRMGARRTALADGGIEWDLPPKLRLYRESLLPKDWRECDVDACATNASTQAACDRFADAIPFRPLKSARRCVRAKPDAGLLCPQRLPDGGSGPSNSFPCVGGCNVLPRAWAADPAQCEPVACSVVAGENPLTALDEEAP